MVYYEWIVEQIDAETVNTDDPEIEDTSAFDTREEQLEFAAMHSDRTLHLGVTRNVGNDVEGITDRSWAYIKDGALPECFEYSTGAQDGVKVPAFIRKEVITE